MELTWCDDSAALVSWSPVAPHGLARLVLYVVLDLRRFSQQEKVAVYIIYVHTWYYVTPLQQESAAWWLFLTISLYTGNILPVSVCDHKTSISLGWRIGWNCILAVCSAYYCYSQHTVLRPVLDEAASVGTGIVFSRLFRHCSLVTTSLASLLAQ